MPLTPSQRVKKWKQKNPDKVREYNSNRCSKTLTEQCYKRIAANPETYLLRLAKRRAKQKGLEFNLEAHDIQIPELCPVLGIPLHSLGQQGEDRRGKCDDSPSIDRIDNTKGYIKGNILIVSVRANRLKSDATPEELMKLAKFYEVTF